MKEEGFTLTELLVSTSIILILTAIAFFGFHKRGYDLALQRSAQLIVSEAEIVREWAISTKETRGSIPSGGYGLHFSLSTPNKFYLFADFSGNHLYDPGEEIRERELEKNILIKEFVPNGSFLDIVFLPPNPDIFFSQSTSEVCLRITPKNNTSKIREICFNKAGLIYEK